MTRARGTAAIELLLVLPLFLVVFLATLAIGQYLLMENELGNATMVTAHRCVAFANRLRSASVACPAAGTIGSELDQSFFGRACDDVQATTQEVSLGDGQRFALTVDASCRIDAGVAAMLSAGRFGVRLPRVVAHATAPLVLAP